MAAWYSSPKWGEPLYPDTVTALMTKLINAYNRSVTEPSQALPHARLHDLRHLHPTTLLLFRRTLVPGAAEPTAAGRPASPARTPEAEVTMALEPYLPVPGHPHDRSAADQAAAAGPAEERKTMPGPRRSSRQSRPPGLPDAGPLEPDIGSFRVYLAAEGKATRTVQGYTGAVRWFAAGYLLSQARKTSWEQADARDIQQWTA